MAITKTQENDKIEVVNKWNIQVRNATIIKEDADVQAICNAAWTTQVKADFKAHLIASKPS